MGVTYKLYVKDCMDIGGVAKAMLNCIAFDVGRDLLEKTTSTFTVLEVADNVNIGDIVGLVDPYGQIIYNGVISEISGVTITTGQMYSIFNDNWRYRVSQQGHGTLEQELWWILMRDFRESNDPIMAAKYNFVFDPQTSTEGSFPTKADKTVVNFEDYLYSIYRDYGIMLRFVIPFGEGTPTVGIVKYNNPVIIKIGDNTHIIQDIIPEVTIVETNKLIVYSQDGLTHRGTYYASVSGISQNASDPTRPYVVKTKYVFSDDEMQYILDQNLSGTAYNHYISFEMLLDNNLYDWYKMELGQKTEIWKDGNTFSTIYTGHRITQNIGEGVGAVYMKCGKFRANLTSKLLNFYMRGDS